MYSLVYKGINSIPSQTNVRLRFYNMIRGQYQLTLKRDTTGIVCMVTRSQDNGRMSVLCHVDNIIRESFIACQPDYFHHATKVTLSTMVRVLFDQDKKGTCIPMTVSTPHFYERTTSLYLTRFLHTSAPHHVLYSSNDMYY